VESITFAKARRVYRLALPAGYDGTRAIPLILLFHGFSGSKEEIAADTGLDARGAKAGFAVVTPDALGSPKQWNMFDAAGQAPDYAFVATLVKHLESELCIDAKRIYAAGHSNGSAFTGFLPCKVPHTFAAIAMVSATIPPICPKTERFSLLSIVGTADPQVPAKGGTVSGSTTGIPPADSTMASYRKDYGCDPKPGTTTPIAGVTEVRGVHCDDGAQVVFDLIEGGTHAWAGGRAAERDQSDSAAGKAFDGTAAVLALFSRP
jgi:polyhydroxybutyrate depolymerase